MPHNPKGSDASMKRVFCSVHRQNLSRSQMPKELLRHLREVTCFDVGYRRHFSLVATSLAV